jgi:hypothetical protein
MATPYALDAVEDRGIMLLNQALKYMKVWLSEKMLIKMTYQLML